jgi:putative DNA primase/helicase
MNESNLGKEVQKDITGATDKDGRATVARLAILSPVEYDRVREEEAKHLGVRAATLDKLVITGRKDGGDDEAQGTAFSCEDIEPWPEPVDGAKVLNEISAFITRYSVQRPGAADVITLWAAHTFVHTAFRYSPRLNITSPEMQCGKSVTRTLVDLFSQRPLKIENLTTATAFRLVEEHRPTILLDEYDTFLLFNDELRGFCNAGYEKGSMYPRCVGDDNEVRMFNAYAPIALFGIGELKGRLATLHDRSIVIKLERAKGGDYEELPDADWTTEQRELTRKLARFMADIKNQLSDRPMNFPPELKRRLKNNWKPLFVIADVVGGDWPSRILNAFRSNRANKDNEARSTGTQLLADIADIFKREGADKLTSSWIVTELADIEGHPWAEYGRGQKPISVNQLATQLSKFGIAPRAIRIGDHTPRGYTLDQFKEAFASYLPKPPIQTATVQQTLSLKDLHKIQTATKEKMLHPEIDVSASVSTDVAVLHPESTPEGILRAEDPEMASPGPGHEHLKALLAVLETQARDGLFPKGHTDCKWSYTDDYPSEFVSAVDHIDDGEQNEAEAIQLLSQIVGKIDAENTRGTPLITADGSPFSSPELQAAKTFLAELDAQAEADFNAGKMAWPVGTDLDRGQSAWHWLDKDETVPFWQEAWKQAMKASCEVCRKSLAGKSYIWFNIKRRVGVCPECKQSEWVTDGYEIDEFGLPSCHSHKHNKEQRIAERDRHIAGRTHKQLRRAARYRASQEEGEYKELYKALLDQEPVEIKQLIVAAFQKVKRGEANSVNRALRLLPLVTSQAQEQALPF